MTFLHWFFQVSYLLTELAKTRLNKIRKEVAPHDVPKKFQSDESLNELVGASGYLNNFFFLIFHQEIRTIMNSGL